MWGRNRVGTRNFLIGIAILAASASIYLLWKERVFDHFTPARIESFLSRFGNYAPLVYILLLAVAIVISQIPECPVGHSCRDAIWNLPGRPVQPRGGMLGATACFFIARFLGISFIRKIFGKVPCFSERCKDSHVAVLIFLSRLMPFFSFDLISYCAGFTNIKTRTFLVATFLGMIPMTFLFTRMGGLIMDQSYLPLLFNGIILIVFLLAPLIVRKYNPFGLKEYITFK